MLKILKDVIISIVYHLQQRNNRYIRLVNFLLYKNMYGYGGLAQPVRPKSCGQGRTDGRTDGQTDRGISISVFSSGIGSPRKKESR